MKQNIIVSSITGNTKLLADCLEKLDLEDDVLYVGFWTNMGQADPKTIKFLQTLENKKVFLFGTCGFGLSEEYFNNIIEKTKKYLNETNTVIGSYMCVGKMPQQVRDRYSKMEDGEKKEMMIHNFDLASSHPNKEDLDKFINTVNNLK